MVEHRDAANKQARLALQREATGGPPSPFPPEGDVAPADGAASQPGEVGAPQGAAASEGAGSGTAALSTAGAAGPAGREAVARLDESSAQFKKLLQARALNLP
jgi:hypothetical protein